MDSKISVGYPGKVFSIQMDVRSRNVGEKS